jgi:DNA-binding beta-propeller fold protein YncE
LTPIDTATGMPGKPIKVGGDPRFVQITPDGKNAIVTSHLKLSYATTISLASKTVIAKTEIAGSAEHFILAPGGKIAYVVSLDPGAITVLNTATGKTMRTYHVQGAPPYIALVP